MSRLLTIYSSNKIMNIKALKPFNAKSYVNDVYAQPYYQDNKLLLL